MDSRKIVRTGPGRLALAAFFTIAEAYGSVQLPDQNAEAARWLADTLDTARIERLTGAAGAIDEKTGVFKVSVPRADLHLKISGVMMTPPLGLTTWAAFQPSGDGSILTGDLVLLTDEVNPVMSVALESGLEVTALHNHFFWADPNVWFMHIGGRGDPDSLASAVGMVFRAMEESPPAEAPFAGSAIDPAETTLTGEEIAQIVGIPGTLKDGVYKITIGKPTEMAGSDLGAAMGVNTWAAFAGSSERAVVDGDFAVYEEELQDVLKALRAADIDIVAIHHHMVGEEPRVLFLHYWGVGSAADLARGVRAALDAQKRASQ